MLCRMVKHTIENLNSQTPVDACLHATMFLLGKINSAKPLMDISDDIQNKGSGH